MGTIRFLGVRFAVYSLDHAPPHIHGSYAEVQMGVELRAGKELKVVTRRGSVQPANASKADVKHILRVANRYYAELVSLWEERHG